MKNLLTEWESFKQALPDKSGIHCGTIHGWFGLSYANYLVLPRVIMEYMPAEWQGKMRDLLEEASEIWEHPDRYTVQLRNDKGQFIEDPLSKYRHPDYTALKEALKKK